MIEKPIVRLGWIVALTVFALGCSPGKSPPPIDELNEAQSESTALQNDTQNGAVGEEMETNSEPSGVEIVLDGETDDWSSVPEIAIDPVGDQQFDGPDFVALKAFSTANEVFALLVVDSYGPLQYFSIDLLLEDGAQARIVIPNNSPVILVHHPSDSPEEPIAVETAWGSHALEVRIPLDFFGQPITEIKGVQATVNDVDSSDSMAGGSLKSDYDDEPELNAYGDLVLPIGFLRDPNYAVDLVFRASPSIFRGTIGPEGALVFRAPWGIENERLFTLTGDGQAVEYISLPGTNIGGFGFDQEGALWITDDNDGSLYLVGADGALAHKVTLHENNFVFGSDNSLYGHLHLGDQVIRITPGGERTSYADGFEGIDALVIGPNDELVVFDESAGILYLVLTGNQKIELLSGPPQVDGQFNPAFAPDGTLYVMVKQDSLYKVDLDTTTATRIDWVSQYPVTDTTMHFDHDGNIVSYSQVAALRLDLNAKSAENIYLPTANTWSLAVAPDSSLYMAYTNGLPGDDGVGYIYTYQQGELQRLLEYPWGAGAGLAISPDNQAYLFATNIIGDGGLFTLDLNQPTALQMMIDREPGGFGLAYDSAGGNLWWEVASWASPNTLRYLNREGQTIDVTTPSELFRTHLAFSPSGTLYAVLWFQPEQSGGAEPHGLYTYAEDTGWVELVDLTQKDPGADWAIPLVCSDEEIYLIQTVDREQIHEDHPGTSFNALFKLVNGELDLIGYDFSYDGTEGECDPNTGQLYFTSAAGIFRVTPLNDE